MVGSELGIQHRSPEMIRLHSLLDQPYFYSKKNISFLGEIPLLSPFYQPLYQPLYHYTSHCTSNSHLPAIFPHYFWTLLKFPTFSVRSQAPNGMSCHRAIRPPMRLRRRCRWGDDFVFFHGWYKWYIYIYIKWLCKMNIYIYVCNVCMYVCNVM